MFSFSTPSWGLTFATESFILQRLSWSIPAICLLPYPKPASHPIWTTPCTSTQKPCLSSHRGSPRGSPSKKLKMPCSMLMRGSLMYFKPTHKPDIIPWPRPPRPLFLTHAPHIGQCCSLSTLATSCLRATGLSLPFRSQCQRSLCRRLPWLLSKWAVPPQAFSLIHKA